MNFLNNLKFAALMYRNAISIYRDAVSIYRDAVSTSRELQYGFRRTSNRISREWPRNRR